MKCISCNESVDFNSYIDIVVYQKLDPNKRRSIEHMEFCDNHCMLNWIIDKSGWTEMQEVGFTKRFQFSRKRPWTFPYKGDI